MMFIVLRCLIEESHTEGEQRKAVGCIKEDKGFKH